VIAIVADREVQAKTAVAVAAAAAAAATVAAAAAAVAAAVTAAAVAATAAAAVIGSAVAAAVGIGLDARVLARHVRAVLARNWRLNACVALTVYFETHHEKSRRKRSRSSRGSRRLLPGPRKREGTSRLKNKARRLLVLHEGPKASNSAVRAWHQPW
jgi:zona occludens toxin (predicted ATPase)